MVSSKAKTVSIVFRAELIAVDEPSGDSFAKTRPRPTTGGVSEAPPSFPFVLAFRNSRGSSCRFR
jgi:hypothetical protein